MAGTFTNLLYHVVYSTKHRERLMEPPLRDDLYSYVGGISRGEGGTLLEIGAAADHVHCLARLRSDPSLAEIVKTVKAKSSKWVNQQKRPGRRFAWQRGYAALTVSPSQLPRVVKYVQNQEQHHRTKTFQEEFIELLEKHGIQYDERYLWD